jgi:molecular chaperone HtpG
MYPTTFDDPLFNIHLNVDYPFNLTGILYFPKIKNNLEIQKNKIQLYSNQVFVTDHVDGIVPDFLMLLHGVLDSPDIPLNVSRSYLQSDKNVKKISAHITKKVADRLHEIFKEDRTKFEEKWDDLKLFVEYGSLTDEKFYEKASKFFLFKNTDGKYFTIEEYETLVKENQTDKHKNIIYLYTDKTEERYSFIEAAKSKGYDVLIMDDQLAPHFINHLEQKLTGKRFVRVDSDVVEKMIEKEDGFESKLSKDDEENLLPVFRSQVPSDSTYFVQFEPMAETANPVIVTQNEFMRRMKDMSTLGGGMAGYYGQMPDSYNLVVNANHALVLKIKDDVLKTTGEDLKKFDVEISAVKKDQDALESLKKDKKEEEIPQEEKDKAEELDKKLRDIEKKKEAVLSEYGKGNKLVKQMIDLALLANNMLKGEALTKFVKRSVELIEE